ncbi:MAG: hypothetical protein EAZ08_10745 [Cytophagales bacterium]|nr:MAG: hypothetical protein EAZ08_10745 [Cytophagales bacterium]
MKDKYVEKKIEETLQQIKSIGRAEAPERLYESINLRIKQRQMGMQASINSQVSMRIVWRVAACLALLVSINCYVWWGQAAANTSDKSDISEFANDYFAEITNY